VMAALGLTLGLATAGCIVDVNNGGPGSSSSSVGAGASGGFGPGSSGVGGAGPSGSSTGSGAGGSSSGAGAGSGSGSGGGPVACNFPGIDLVLGVDNSRGTAYKQELLAQAIPELLAGLTNPPCVDGSGVPSPLQPASGFDACPAGTDRIFAPQNDIHIGVVTTSIGGHGSDSCSDINLNQPECAGAANTTNNDKGHLLNRQGPCAGSGTVPTYQGKSFLAWDPAQVLSPPGEGTLSDGAGNGLIPTLQDLVLGAGSIGCGYESQLESVYRFLADPEPYASISTVNNKATPTGIDQVLLQQRAEFLRPDSLLAVLSLSEENDCSTKEYGQFYYVNQIRTGATDMRLPRARQECATDPNDECCKSCGQDPGNCPADPTCSAPLGVTLLTADEDNINLRCWEQKRRFGIDFLYPIDRYTQAFSSPMITDSAGDLVPNPIFSDLNPNDGSSKVRDPSLVLFAGILGVPWQDIARDPSDATKGFKAWDELNQPVAGAPNAWDIIVGDPKSYVPAQDPLMRESLLGRAGNNPITGAALVGPGSMSANPINGSEYTIDNDDLQFACIFPLPPSAQKDCSDPSHVTCECADPLNDSPLCAPNPNDGNSRTLQTHDKAYPSLRQLALAKSLGPQAAIGSACAPQTANPSGADFGYKQSVKIVLDWLSRRGC
jgi:hypothetical protein